jgi:Holliday junction resolvase-like predicted endonuclease
VTNTSSIDPANRQVLVNLGNRFVVFGPGGGLPEPLRFDPQNSPILPRVADEGDVAESRITETLQVSGMTRVIPGPDVATGNADIELVDPAGNRILVEIKVRERDPRQRDLTSGIERLNLAKSEGQNLEEWFFNTERLKLTVMRLDGADLRFDHFVPLNVWEKTTDGIFERRRVVEEVEDWLYRVEHLYSEIREWLGDNNDLSFEQTRTVTMSEEMMQEFAVTDRELSVLDVLRGDQVVASFVPRGLWLIGAWGRIDVITRDSTSILVAIKNLDTFEWQLTSRDDRQRSRYFDKSALLDLIGSQ